MQAVRLVHFQISVDQNDVALGPLNASEDSPYDCGRDRHRNEQAHYCAAAGTSIFASVPVESNTVVVSCLGQVHVGTVTYPHSGHHVTIGGSGAIPEFEKERW